MPYLLRHGTSVFKVISERLVILTSECRALDEGAISTYFKRLRFDEAGPIGARTHVLPIAKREHYHWGTATGLLKTYNLSKCASGASKLVSYQFYI
jgi:hypothetical protein